MSLRGVIAAHGSEYTVTRLATGTLVKGKYTDGAPATFPIIAFWEPLTGSELEDTAEGRRGNELRTVYTETELRDGRTGVPDSIEIDNEPWTVIKAEKFSGLGGTHYRAAVARTSSP